MLVKGAYINNESTQQNCIHCQHNKVRLHFMDRIEEISLLLTCSACIGRLHSLSYSCFAYYKIYPSVT